MIRTPDQRLRVFVSSTLQELATERAAVKEAITRLHLVPVMFELGSRPHPPADLYRAYLEQSHVFIGVYWERYGWVAPDMEISGLEDEWVRATDHPKLVYIKESRGREPRLAELLARIRDSGSTSYHSFAAAEELRELVENDLAVLLSETFQSATEPLAAPPTTAPSAPPHAPSSIIGRDVELRTLEERVRREDTRLVTITGSGGCGKTRLAIALAERLEESFGGRVAFVDLSGLRSASPVLPTIADALGVKDAGGRPLIQAVASVTEGERLLLVVDNFEHVVDAATDLAELLSATSGVTVVATSRQALRLRWEHEFPLHPLAVPDPKEQLSVDAVAVAPAVELLLERVHRVRPRFQLDHRNVGAVAEIARRLDGLPLALELAAARLRVLQPDELLARLEHRLDSLAASSPDLPERHRTMRAAISWSHDQLTDAEQRVFRRMGVFAGSAGIDAIAAVCQGEDLDAESVVEVIESLVDKSLIACVEDDRGGLLFRMLATIREYAVEELVAADEAEATWDRQLAWYVDVAERAWDGFWTSEMSAWLAVLDQEHDNLRSALDHAAGAGDARAGLRIAAGMWPWWDIGGQYREGERRLRQLLELTTDVRSAVRGRALNARGWMIALQGDFDSALGLMEEGLSMVRECGTREEVAWTLAELGNVAFSLGKSERTDEVFAECLEIAEEFDDIFLRGFAHFGLAYASFLRGDLERMKHELDESLELTRFVIQPWGIAWAQFSLGIVAILEGDTRAAVGPVTESLELRWSIRDARGLAESIQLLANLASAHGETDWSALLHGAAELQREACGLTILPFLRPLHDESFERLQAALGPEELERLWRLGRAMPIEKLVPEALNRTVPDRQETR